MYAIYIPDKCPCRLILRAVFKCLWALTRDNSFICMVQCLCIVFADNDCLCELTIVKMRIVYKVNVSMGSIFTDW